ncbi:molybdenum ABC transporter ATP-binding protein [Halioxenophilus aromaticivorans]|uniref:Molybdenum ABC transporter ATP-binding protein n=1 Tax=Halioxenophilus aromaticivorans TaxID=1306992 RepID=A0AAV3U2C3_9ALTE
MASISLAYKVARPGFSLDVAFDTQAAGITALFGQSGSGKTTLLRCIAGLETATEGRFIIDGETWQDANVNLPTHQRNIGYVFQEANLLGHLSVEKNLRYAVKRQRQPSLNSANPIRLDDTVQWLGLSDLLGKYSAQLSGGQRQRVAIARALLTNPKLLLMDEPLASLDLHSKAEILPYLEQLQAGLNIPIFYVSHSPDEVIRLADSIALLQNGRLLAHGPVNEILTRTDLPLAQLEEASACVDGQVVSHDDRFHLTYVSLRGGTVAISRRQAMVGSSVRVRISAKDVSIALAKPENTSITNVLPVTIAEIQPAPDPAKLVLKLAMDGDYFLSQITRLSAQSLGLGVGKSVFAQVKSVALMRN